MFLCAASPAVTIERHGEKSKTVVEGHDVELSCTAWGWPLPSVIWSHENSQINLTDLQNETSIGNVSITLGLNVKNLNLSDRGDFICTGKNFFNETEHVGTDEILVRVKGQCDCSVIVLIAGLLCWFVCLENLVQVLTR